ncbi:creatininase family protein [Dictyobacter kobayashii]|uniref:Creatinine amidohydrolase n=1 Tax=Dictyobacter kobayashii TaxID=2014872 RepID=A0A402AFW4_9CHLR|nr:creatininase family protein [Dictyobacter kobayashii]GCE17954.1 creatinine amidohydrolase [Dictyobacter kobayashii]
MKVDRPANQMLKAQQRIVLLPIGSCEQHGPYLPIDTDLRIAQLLAEKLEKQFSDDECLLLPPIPFSCSWEHKGNGTIALSHSTIASIIHDIAYNLKYWAKPDLFILLNWHGGNNILSSLSAEITAKEDIPTTVINAISETSTIWFKNCSNPDKIEDIHAGAIETSIIQAYWPNLVKENIPANAKYQVDINPSIMHSALQAFNTYQLTKEGIWGDPSLANPENGKKAIEQVSINIYNQVQDILTLMKKLEKES